MNYNKVLIQVSTYPYEKGKTKSLIVDGEDYVIVHSRIENLFEKLAQNEEVTITHKR